MMRSAMFFCCVALAVAVTFASVSSSFSFQDDRVPYLPDYGWLISAMYAGYIPTDTEGRQAYYWFIESENNPQTDPLVLWLQGGPGCSSVQGSLEEMGPYFMRHGGEFVLNEYRWNTNVSMLFLESPAGVGFSKDTNPPIQWNDVLTAAYNYAALKGWLKKFPQYVGRKFFIAGESYAGHYVPQLADAILTGDSEELRSMMQGFMVGNGCTGTIGCANPDPTLDVFLTYHGFMPLNASIPTGDANYDHYDVLAPTCTHQQEANSVRFSHPIVDAFKERLKAAPPPYGPCADQYVTAWMNRDDVKRLIHADTSITWQVCSTTVNYDLNLNGVTDLYEKFFAQTNWSIMLYSGTADTVVNFVQTQTIVNEFKRPLAKPKFTPWYYPDVYDPTQLQLGGFYLQFDKLAWAGVRDAGHMVPQYNPPAGKELFMSFITTGRPGRH